MSPFSLKRSQNVPLKHFLEVKFLQFFKTSTKSISGDRVERGELLGPDADPA